MSGKRGLVLGSIVAVALGELAVAWLALHPNVDEGYRAYYIEQSTTCLDKPVGGQYPMGQTVSFLPDDQAGARQLRVCGWDGPAGDGTHSIGTSSMLRFAVSGPTDGLILRLMLTAITAPDQRDQRIVLSGNGVAMGEATIPDSVTTTLDFHVPDAAFASTPGKLDVVIDYPTATEMTPRDSNTHYRSIKLLGVQLRRPDQHASEGPQEDPVALRNHAGPDQPIAP